jgi:hypothetical protein
MDLSDQIGEFCSRVREGTGADGQPVYAYDFNDDGMGGTEDHPYFTVSSPSSDLFSAGEVYQRQLLEEIFGLAGGIPVPPSPLTEPDTTTGPAPESELDPEDPASSAEVSAAPPRTRRPR